MKNKIVDYEEIEQKEAECNIKFTEDELQEIAEECERAFWEIAKRK